MPYLIDVRAGSAAPAEVVFEHLAVAEAWGVWGRFPARPVRERPGADSPNGTGAIRRIWPAREQVVEYRPPAHYAYVAVSGLPIRNYRADVTLAPAEDGTAIRWRGVSTRSSRAPARSFARSSTGCSAVSRALWRPCRPLRTRLPRIPDGLGTGTGVAAAGLVLVNVQ